MDLEGTAMMKRLIAVMLLIVLCITISACAEKSSDKGLELRKYSFQESDDIVPASVTLMEDNKFQFIFSAMSSYICMGSYSVDGDKLLLNADEGGFYYTFNITADGLVFDAENSSDNLWFADFTDGSVFR